MVLSLIVLIVLLLNLIVQGLINQISYRERGFERHGGLGESNIGTRALGFSINFLVNDGTALSSSPIERPEGRFRDKESKKKYRHTKYQLTKKALQYYYL